jgi:hypothetical protein
MRVPRCSAARLGLLSMGTVLALAPALVRAQAPPAPPPASPALEWKSEDGKNKFKIGFLGQAQLESIDDTIKGGDAQQNLFMRRARILLNYSWGDKVSVFAQTDSPNLGKGDGAGGKNEGDVFIQDLVITYNRSNAFKLDGGMLLPALTYNHTQSAASLLTLDYGAATFDESAPLRQRVGRDYGLQARGYLAKDKVEYRAAILQGVRGRRPAANRGFEENNFRLFGRLVYWAYGPQKALYYRGTSLGKTKSLGIGVSADRQEDYEHTAVDLFVDHPLKGGNGISFQADFANIDGDVFVALPKRTNAMAEFGFYVAKAKIMPYVHYAKRDLDKGADTTWTEIGLGKYFAGHNHNMKIAFTQIETTGARDRSQFRVQWQVFGF